MFPYYPTINGARVQTVQAVNYTINPSATGISWADNEYATNKPILSGYTYPAVPANWESMNTLYSNKPTWQLVGRQWLGMQFGGASELPSDTNFTPVTFPHTQYTYTGYDPFIPGSGLQALGIGLGPYSYWNRDLNVYTAMMQSLDEKYRYGTQCNS
jgi:hypothetical protein